MPKLILGFIHYNFAYGLALNSKNTQVLDF